MNSAKTSTLKVAFAGLGSAFRHIHLPAYKKLSRLKVVGGMDVEIDGKFDFPVFSNIEEMLEKTRPDILSVTTPPQFHFELTRAGLRAGCHVICEKPFMETMAEANTIVALAKQVGRWVVVNNQYRFMNIHQEAKRWIGKSDFGKLLFVSAQQTFFVTEQTEAGWRGQDQHRTCKEFGTHILDLCRYYYGEDPSSLLARMPKGDNPRGPDYLNLIQLEFSGDRVAHIMLDRLSRGPHNYLTIRLDGNEGCIETRLGGGIEMAAGVRGGTRKPYMNFDVSLGGRARLYHGEKFKKIAKDPIDVFAHATSKLMASFIDALDRDELPPNNAEDNRKTLALMLAACESGQSNQPVRLDYQPREFIED